MTGKTQAIQAIGEFFCAFSELERELGESLKVVLQLRGHPAADTIVSIVQDFARKARIVQAGVQGAKKADGMEPEPAWEAEAIKTLGAVLGCNKPDRVLLAHSYLEPQPDGSLNLYQSGGKNPVPWGEEELATKVKNLRELTAKLKDISAELTTLVITVPSGELFLSGEGSATAGSAFVVVGGTTPGFREVQENKPERQSGNGE